MKQNDAMRNLIEAISDVGHINSDINHELNLTLNMTYHDYLIWKIDKCIKELKETPEAFLNMKVIDMMEDALNEGL